LAQTVYYFYSAFRTLEKTGADSVQFSVPTGNFGDILAGYIAQRMGLPVSKLSLATNENDILSRFFNSGTYGMADVVPTLSPSMDIQVASNFERLLFDLASRDGAATEALMQELSRSGRFSVPQDWIQRARACFASARVDEETTTRTIAELEQSSNLLVDPHTAVALRAAMDAGNDDRMVTLSTAHPAKFPEAVERAVGHRPALPASMADLLQRTERMTTLPNDLATVQDFVRGHARPTA